MRMAPRPLSRRLAACSRKRSLHSFSSAFNHSLKTRYYLYYMSEVKAFPEGFEMLAGTPLRRSFEGPFPDEELSSWPSDPSNQTFLEERALGFNCLNYAKTPEASLYRHTMPDKEYLDANCPDGIRLELGFPSCGNGDTTSDDHKSHVKYPNLVKEGNCPESHPIHYPFLFYETIWATNAFAGEAGSFVLSNGDPTGCGYHADFMMGWESSDFLQQALDTCTSPSGKIEDCPIFETQDDATSAECTFDMPERIADDNNFGSEDGLPVNVPIQGWGQSATRYPVAGRQGVKTTAMPYTADSTTSALPTLSYSSANASETETAPGGIVIAMASTDEYAPESSTTTVEESYPTVEASSFTTEAAPAPTTVPSYEEPVYEGGEIITTKYMTQGNEVVEMVVEEVAVTVTATATPSSDSYDRGRHLHNHKHKHIR